MRSEKSVPLKEEGVEIGKVKEMVLAAIVKKYESVDKFLETEEGKSIGKNLKTYLYPSGAVSFPVLQELCRHFGIGELTRETLVKRSIVYKITSTSIKVPRKTKRA